MAQARRKTAKKKTSLNSNSFGMFFSGLVVGAVATSFITGLRSGDPDSIGRGIEHMISTSRNQADAQTATPQAQRKPELTTSYEFYEILPEIEQIVPIPDVLKDESKKPQEIISAQDSVETVEKKSNISNNNIDVSNSLEATKKASGRYLLQAGSFKKESDADRLRAELALSGLFSKIQKVSIEGRGNFYRVRLGPYQSIDELTPVNKQLEGMRIKPLMLKVVAG